MYRGIGAVLGRSLRGPSVAGLAPRLTSLYAPSVSAGLTSLAGGGQQPPWSQPWHGTTILCVRKGGKVVMIGDGQVTQGSQVVKGNARKVRRIGKDIVVGFAGTAADAFTLMERLERHLEEHGHQLTRACVELAKAWRTDKYLRRLEAVMLVADSKVSFELTGTGDVLDPQYNCMGVGSGGAFALAAARALMDSELSAEDIAHKAMGVASELCVYTNGNYTVEIIDCTENDDGDMLESDEGSGGSLP